MRLITYIMIFGLILLAGCDEDKQTMALVPKDAPAIEESTYCNKAGQYVESILAADMNPWLKNHLDCEIITLTSVSMTASNANSNPTTGFIIVYKKKS